MHSLVWPWQLQAGINVVLTVDYRQKFLTGKYNISKYDIKKKMLKSEDMLNAA